MNDIDAIKTADEACELILNGQLENAKLILNRVDTHSPYSAIATAFISFLEAALGQEDISLDKASKELNDAQSLVAKAKSQAESMYWWSPSVQAETLNAILEIAQVGQSRSSNSLPNNQRPWS